MKRFYVSFVLLVILLGGLGILHGVWTDRWPTLAAAEQIADLDRVPPVVGNWEGKRVENSASATPLADAGNMLIYRYVNQNDGNVVSVLLTRGRPGPMVIQHLPTECYISNGYEIQGQPKRYLSSAGKGHPEDEFWVATFSKTNQPVPVHVRVYWSWSGNGAWQTPDRPRMTFARYPVLYKLCVVQPLLAADDPFENAPSHEFIREFTGDLRKSFFAPAS